MHFCTECDNMYYIRISSDDENKIIYYCRKCGHENDTITKNNICISKTVLKRKEQKFSNIINEYTKLDMTLPRTNTIKCPNEQCVGGEDNEVIYMRFDDINMKYIYICSSCGLVWKIDK